MNFPAAGENGKIFQLPQLIWKNLEVEFAAPDAAARNLTNRSCMYILKQNLSGKFWSGNLMTGKIWNNWKILGFRRNTSK